MVLCRFINIAKFYTNNNINFYRFRYNNKIMTQEEILKEIKRCNDSPYYFAIKYIKVKNHRDKDVPYRTILSEEEFNQMFKNYEKQ